MPRLPLARLVVLVLVVSPTVEKRLLSQTVTIWPVFSGPNGSNPTTGLVQGFDGNLYGTTDAGGTIGWGTAFKITNDGQLTSLYSFSLTDGSGPLKLTLGTDGFFYGPTIQAGLYGWGTLVKISPDGVFTKLHDFTHRADGARPASPLVQTADGNFYGVTGLGGANNKGTVFRMTPAGKVVTIYNFAGSTDGASPSAGLAQGRDGNLYGTTPGGGANKVGTIFRLAPTGVLTTLYSFQFADGSPDFPLVQGTDGALYGITLLGDPYNSGAIYRISLAGQFTMLYQFTGLTDGANPSGLVQANDGYLYGTTNGGGTDNLGTIFRISAAGAFQSIYSFTDSVAGRRPVADLVQATNGLLYGTTEYSLAGAGAVFSLSLGLSPFIQIVPPSGKVSSSIQVLGNNLDSTSAVAFRGVQAAFTVWSASQITAVVPAGASTGTVRVTTSNGTLSSKTAFQVRPELLAFSPMNGPVGTKVVITGNAFAGTTRVTFGGVLAPTSSVDSYNQVTASVPSDAKTGKITLTTPGGTAVSTGTFTVN
jgi:uncharacterized repeat protein (TIGR03803 family)